MKKTYDIAVIPGDGTGPEVVAEGIKVLEAAAAKFNFGYQFSNYDIGGDHYLATEETISDQQLDSLAQKDAIFLGAIGHPEVKPGVLEKGILLKIRFTLDQYINLR
jgi:3-isopropylmalate dehydrogenase